MHGLSEEIYNKIIELINKHSDVQFKLFGSRAKGTEKINSDIDIAILGEIKDEEKFNIKNDFDILNIPYKIDLVFISEISSKEFLEAILNEGVDF